MAQLLLAMANIGKEYQYVGILVSIIIGFAIVLKAGKWWGWLAIAAALYWAYRITMPMFR
ncbi:MAG: hypothetical protein BWZ10_01171 [candidate division BRC1 bacterium ADurb.BinA364]|nr:MAG: hypothetical protein BWZ10_01171 [candidate division BRC1 bacterium ADurb.BinA364]